MNNMNNPAYFGILLVFRYEFLSLSWVYGWPTVMKKNTVTAVLNASLLSKVVF